MSLWFEILIAAVAVVFAVEKVAILYQAAEARKAYKKSKVDFEKSLEKVKDRLGGYVVHADNCDGDCHDKKGLN